MAKYILKRLLRSLLTLFVIITIVFSLLRLMPIEGYFQNYEKMTQTQIDVGLAELGLNLPLPLQLLNFYGDLLHGDLGVSNKYRRNVEVVKIIAEKVPISMTIGMVSLVIALAVGLPLGILMARSTRTKYKIGDKLGTAFIVLVQAIPAAVYYLVIQFFGTSALNMPLRADLDRPYTLILPVLSLSLGNIAYYAMWLRRYMVDESNKDYVRLARAKGVPAGVISRRHIFRNAFVPLVQFHPNLGHSDPDGFAVCRKPLLDPRHGWAACHRHPAAGQHRRAGARAVLRRDQHPRDAGGRFAHGAA